MIAEVMFDSSGMVGAPVAEDLAFSLHLDPDGRIRSVEGDPPQDLVGVGGGWPGRSSRDLFTPAAELDRMLARALGGAVVAGDLAATARRFACICQPLRGSGGDIVGALLSLRDDTAAQAREAAIREELLRYQTLADVAHDMIFMLDADLRVVLINRFAAAQLRRSPGELIGRSQEELFQAADAKRMADRLRQVLATGKPMYIESRIEFPEGIRWLDSRLIPIADQQGRVTAILGMSRDISARKRAEEALQQSEERARMLMETARDAIFIYDRDGVIVDLNPSSCQMSGFRREELLGTCPFDYMPPEVATAAREIFAAVVRTGTGAGEVPMFRKNGVVRIIDWCGSLLPDGRVLGVARDVTEKRQLIQEQLRTQKLEALGVLAGGIAHDFNNLLTIILGNLSLARMMLPAGASQSLAKLHEAESGAFRARDLTQQLLTFSHAGAPVKQAAAVSQIIKDSASFVLHGSRVQCDFVFSPDLWPVEVDPGQFSRVISNLVINAGQAMSQGGQLTITADNTRVDAHSSLQLPAGDYVRIAVQDTGSGIPVEIRERVFEPYFSTKSRGSGLGLAVCHSIIRQHGGHIGIDSTVGVGTTMTIHLPRSRIAPAVAAESARPGPMAGGTILVMDDDEGIRRTATEFLNHLGFSTVTASDGEEAVALYRERLEQGQPFVAVILDLTVPGGLGGQEAMARLLALDPRVKAVVSSGYSVDPVMADHRRHGFQAVLTKPYRLEDLKACLAAVLDRVVPGR